MDAMGVSVAEQSAGFAMVVVSKFSRCTERVTSVPWDIGAERYKPIVSAVEADASGITT
jgi:hypothetical protein